VSELGVFGVLYSEVLFPALPVIETVQTTLSGLASIIVLPAIAQMLWPAVKRRPKILSYEMWVDVLYALQAQLLYVTSLGVAVAVSVSWLEAKTPVLFAGLASWPLWIQVVLAVWIFDFVVYWRHRLEHQLSFLWPIHAVHHTSEQIDVLTTTRLHFLEVMLGAILNLWVTTRFGVSASAASLGFLIYLNYNYYLHTNVRIVHPGVLKYVFVSPFMHRWHHAREDQARDRNFGVVFAWNDWLFGSALHPDREPHAYGIDYPAGEVARESFFAHAIYPLQVLVARLARLGAERATDRAAR
jgi:sterol desaturase/sphingolipid hydroxylase (fatty acid hydroxylase superfamily)